MKEERKKSRTDPWGLNLKVIVIEYFFHKHKGKNNKNVKVPNLSKVKRNMVADLEKKKTLSSREELIQNLKEKMTKSNTMVEEYPNMNSYMTNIDSKRVMYDPSNDTFMQSYQDEEKKANRENQDQSKRAYLKDLREVIQNSDVILEVLDSRDPLSCKSNELEELVRSHKDEKKIIIILNKIDLIPT